MAEICIVGHGPSINSGLGAVIDTMKVLRLKRGLLPAHDVRRWGSRTDYLCARSPRFDQGKHPFWLLSAPEDYPDTQLPKPTTGLCAVVEAVKRGYTDIALIGFDRLLHPEIKDSGQQWIAHDKWREHEYLKTLPVKITDLRTYGGK